MKINILSFYAAWILVTCLPGYSMAQNQGEATFKQVCAACHTVGKGRLVGPDLMNVHQRRTEEWLLKFIKSSQTVIKGGDAYADSLFKAFNQVMMPDQAAMSDIQIKEVLAYIQSGSTAGLTSAAQDGTAPAVLALTGDVQRGRELFIGNIRFTNGGPTCNSCHNVNLEGYLSGGILARDLTQAVTRLTEDGVKGVISGLPFPQMKQSYQARPLTGQEIADLTAFLKQADQQANMQVTAGIGNKMLLGGIAGVIVLLILFSFFWIKRKQRTVNYSIYERQIKSM